MTAIKQEPSWESIVLAGDGTTWSPKDWEWDAVNLTAQPRRRSARIEQAGKHQQRPCAAAARLASHLGEQPTQEAQQESNQSGAKAAQERAVAGGADRGPSSSSCSNRAGPPGGSAAERQASGGKAASKGKAQLAGRRPVCQADGCHRDLSTLTYYHQRNRICEVHIKADAFLRDGEELRFCQRCGHSHPLGEFDLGKHSCRKQLEKHNARRRKKPAKAQGVAGGGASKAAGREGKNASPRAAAVAAAAAAARAAGRAQQPGGGASPCASSSSPPGKAKSAAAAEAAEDAGAPAWFQFDAGLLGGPAGDQERVEVTAVGTRVAPGAPGHAGSASLSRAQERLAARIARLTAAGADVSVLQQGGAPAQPAATAAGAAAGTACTACAGPPGAAAASEAPQAPALLAGPSGPRSLLRFPPMLPELGGAALAGGEKQEGSPCRPVSPLLPLLDFDLDQFGLPQQAQHAAPAGTGGAARSGQVDGAGFEEVLNEWISRQLMDHALLSDPEDLAPAPAPQLQQHGAAPAPAQYGAEAVPAPAPAGGAGSHGAPHYEAEDMLLSLFEDHDLPPLPGAIMQCGLGAEGAAGPALPAPALPYAQHGAQAALGPTASVGQHQQQHHHHDHQQQQLQHWLPAAHELGAGPAAAAMPSLILPSQQLQPPQQQQQQQGSYAVASGLVALGMPAPLPPLPPPQPLTTLQRVSVKLFGCTPEELPTDLRQQVTGWFGSGLAAMDGYIRPGCVHLTLQAIMQREGGQQAQQGQAAQQEGSSRAEPASASSCCASASGGGARSEGASCCSGGGSGSTGEAPQQAQQAPSVAGVLSSMAAASGCDLWRRSTMLIQCGGELGLVHGGELWRTWDVRTAAAARAVPRVDSVSPPVVVAGRPAAVRLAGVNLMQDDCELLARMHGAYVPLRDARCADCCCAAPSAAAAGSCCRGGIDDEKAAAAGWEQRCCGCCTAKLQPGPGGAAGGGEEGAGESGGAPGAPAAASLTAQGQQQQQQRRRRQQGPGPSLQSVRVLLPQDLPPGLLHVDVQRGAFSAPQGARLLVVDSEAVQQEVLGLQARLPSQAFDSLLDQMGLVYEWAGRSGGGAGAGGQGGPEYGLVELTAARLLYWCVSSGLRATAAFLLRVLGRGAPAGGLAGALAAAAGLACHDGLSLLHRAVQSRNVEMTEAVLSWGEEAGAPWRCDLPGPLGITPLHLAAAAGAGALALLEPLLLRCAGGPGEGAAAWRSACTADGLTPEQFAALSGAAAAAEEVLRQLAPAGGSAEGSGKAAAEGPGEEEEEERREEEEGGRVEGEQEGSLSVQQPSTPRRCRCTGDCPCARASQPCAWCEEDDAGSGSELGGPAGTGAGAGSRVCGKACGLGAGWCGCCGQGGGGADGQGEGGGSSGGGQGAAARGGAGGCCGGDRRGGCAGPGSRPSGQGMAGGSGGQGSCCGGSGSGGAGAPAPGADAAADREASEGQEPCSLGARVCCTPPTPERKPLAPIRTVPRLGPPVDQSTAPSSLASARCSLAVYQLGSGLEVGAGALFLRGLAADSVW